MRIPDMNQLEYLHDATVSEIALTYDGDSKFLRIVATCDDECGYDEWSSKTVVVTLSNLVRASGFVLGHVAGHETIQSFGEGASEEMLRSMHVLGNIGISAPKTFLRLTLQSGSEIEIACGEVDVCTN